MGYPVAASTVSHGDSAATALAGAAARGQRPGGNGFPGGTCAPGGGGFQGADAPGGAGTSAYLAGLISGTGRRGRRSPTRAG